MDRLGKLAGHVAGPPTTVVAELAQLGNLFIDGLLTDSEFGPRCARSGLPHLASECMRVTRKLGLYIDRRRCFTSKLSSPPSCSCGQAATAAADPGALPRF